MTSLPARLLLLYAVVAAAACDDSDAWSPEELSYGGHGGGDLVLGRVVYGRYCAGCHGAAGDGNGPAARFLDPKPRDFRTGKVKFAAVPAGELPRDEDLLAILEHGLAGTSMPSWNLVPIDERRAVIAYLKTFSDAFARKAPGVPVAVGKDPWRRDPEAGRAEGERVYHGVAGCITCHPAYVTRPVLYAHQRAAKIAVDGFRDDLYRAVAKDSEWGAPITPPDFLVDRIKTGFHKERIVGVIAAGVGGTAMPTWAGGLTDRQLWGLAYYLETLALLRDTPAGRELARSLAEQPPFNPPAEDAP